MLNVTNAQIVEQLRENALLTQKLFDQLIARKSLNQYSFAAREIQIDNSLTTTSLLVSKPFSTLDLDNYVVSVASKSGHIALILLFAETDIGLMPFGHCQAQITQQSDIVGWGNYYSLSISDVPNRAGSWIYYWTNPIQIQASLRVVATLGGAVTSDNTKLNVIGSRIQN